MEYLCDFYMKVGQRCIDYYKPDIVCVTDDTAAWKNPFFSVEMYRELFKPYHARQAAMGTDRGLPVEMHNCGRCEDFIDDWRDFGVVMWNPAQTSNDLPAVKKKYGRGLVICGGWDIVGDLQNPDVSEETVKESVYKAIDTYAPGGGYAFCGGFDRPATKRRCGRTGGYRRPSIHTAVSFIKALKEKLFWTWFQESVRSCIATACTRTALTLRNAKSVYLRHEGRP